MLENGIHGEISVISERHATANLHTLPTYDPTQETSHLIYLDANNLYGFAMSQYLPTSNFRWVPENRHHLIDVESIPDDAERGYIFDVDLEYPHHLHNLHNEYPLAPERKTVTFSMLSDEHQRSLECLHRQKLIDSGTNFIGLLSLSINPRRN